MPELPEGAKAAAQHIGFQSVLAAGATLIASAVGHKWEILSSLASGSKGMLFVAAGSVAAMQELTHAASNKWAPIKNEYAKPLFSHACALIAGYGTARFFVNRGSLTAPQCNKLFIVASLVHALYRFGMYVHSKDSNDSDPKAKEMSAEDIAALEKERDELKAERDGLKTDKETLEGEKGALQLRVTDFEDKAVANARADLTTANARVKREAKELADAKSAAETAQTALEGLEGKDREVAEKASKKADKALRKLEDKETKGKATGKLATAETKLAEAEKKKEEKDTKRAETEAKKVAAADSPKKGGPISRIRRSLSRDKLPGVSSPSSSANELPPLATADPLIPVVVEEGKEAPAEQ